MRFLFITMRVEIHSPKISKTSYYVSSASCQKSSTSVIRKVSKLDHKVKAINLCDGGKNCWAVVKEMGVGHTQIMNILKRKREILKIMFPVEENVNVVLYHIKNISSTINVNKSNIIQEQNKKKNITCN